MKGESIAAISIFSGCGGLDIGCEMAGIPVISCLDFDRDSIMTLKANRRVGGEKILADIREVPSDYLKGIANAYGPDKLIVIGGPPCQPFSKAGYWIGHKARKMGNDPRNMIGEYLRVIGDLRPSGFLFENVESMMHPTNKSVVDEMLANMIAMGYKVKLLRANAQDYGVPQKRKRIFVIGTRKGFSTDLPQRTHAPTEMCNGNGFLPYRNAGETISKYNFKRYAEKEEITDGGTYHDELEEVPPGENYIALTRRAGYPNPKFEAGKRFWSFLLKLSPDMPSWTIPAQPGPWVGPFHWNSRRLRVPEIAAIQTFPEDYIFCGSRRSVQKQIGNAVPPLMGKAMVEFLKVNV